MKTTTIKTISGFTLTELMVTIVIAVIFFLAAAATLVDSQRAWGNLYGKVHSGVASDSFVVKKSLDVVVRKASSGPFSCLVDDDGQWVEVQYYVNDDSTTPDHYAKFYVAGDELIKETGTISPQEALSSETVCSNVSDCTFKKSGKSVRMILRLDDDSEQSAVITSSVMNNP